MDFSSMVIFVVIFGVCLTQPYQRIAGGNPVSIEQFPSTAAILRQDDLKYSLRCGAAILTSYYVLTAANCVTEKLKVRVGSNYWSSGGRFMNVITKTIHPDFKTQGVDLAILGLDQPIVFNENTVAQAPLPFEDMEPMVGMAAFVVGWGAKDLCGEPSETLKFGQLSITARAQCAQDYSIWNPTKNITENHICASGPNVGLCNGDLGSPLYSAGVLVGIASFTLDCGQSEVPSVYTHVSRYISWIQKEASGVPNS